MHWSTLEMNEGAVLVTGGAGYVGSHFVARFAGERRRLVVLDNLSRGDARLIGDGRLVRGDIGDATLVEEICRDYAVDVAVHFAAYAYVGESVSEPGRYYENNVANTIAFLAGLRRAGVRSLVFSSSCATYGEPRDGASISESERQVPVNPYGRTKLMVEQILNDYEAAYGFRAVCLRYFNAAGASERHALYERHDPETHLIPLAIDAAIGPQTLTVFGSDYPTPDGTCIRDYVHVDDLADAHIQAVERLRGGGASLRANLGIGAGASVLQVIAAVQGCTGRTVRHDFGARRPGDPPILVANAALAQRELGWQPHYDSLESIVRTAVAGHRRKLTALPLPTRADLPSA